MEKINYLEAIKEIELGILDDFIRVCKEYNLRYYIVYGTLLGAIRHNGFIPWDDDIDVAMPRNDYEKFKKIWKQNMQSQHELQNWENTTNYPFIFPKIINKDTSIKEKAIEHVSFKYGVYIDIFVLDGVHSNRIIRFYEEYKYKFTYKIIRLHYIEQNKVNSFLRVLKKVIADRLNIISIQRKNEKMLSKNDFDTSALCRIQLAFSRDKYMPRNFFDGGREVVFEGRTLMAPQRVNEFLEMEYGDYMTLPPKENRISVHNFTSLIIKNIRYI